MATLDGTTTTAAPPPPRAAEEEDDAASCAGPPDDFFVERSSRPDEAAAEATAGRPSTTEDEEGGRADDRTAGEEGEGATTATTATLLLPPPSSWFREPPAPAANGGGEGGTTSEEEAISRAAAGTGRRAEGPDAADAADLAACDDDEASRKYDLSYRLPSDLLPCWESDFDSRTFDDPDSDELFRAAGAQLAASSSYCASSAALAAAWKDVVRQSSQTVSRALATTIPRALGEASTVAFDGSVRVLRAEYAKRGPGRAMRASDMGAAGGGYFVPPDFRDALGESSSSDDDGDDGGGDGDGDGRRRADASEEEEGFEEAEARFTNLPWIERQLVREWRTYDWETGTGSSGGGGDEGSEAEATGRPAGRRRRGEVEPSGDGGDGEGGADEGRGVTDDNDGHVEAVGGTFQRDFEEEKEGGDDDPTLETSDDDDDDEEEEEWYAASRSLAPRPLPRPTWRRLPSCQICHRTFGPALRRHHCRRCGRSLCRVHSSAARSLPHLGYDPVVPERVCATCADALDDRDLHERVSWRLARCRDYLRGELVPYFETGVDTVEDAVGRLARLAVALARRVPLGAQAYVALETVEVLRKHGLKGVYGLLLRKEFLAAADLLCRALGIDRERWPLGVHELSAAIFYALARHRALRGVRPEGEEASHALRREAGERDGGEGRGGARRAGRSATPTDAAAGAAAPENAEEATDEEDDVDEDTDCNGDNNSEDDDAGDEVVWTGTAAPARGRCDEPVLDETDVYDPASEPVVDLLGSSSPGEGDERRDRVAESIGNSSDAGRDDIAAPPTSSSSDEPPNPPPPNPPPIVPPFEPVCDPVPDALLSSLLRYAPLALDFVYAEREADMQLLAAQQGWRLVYASLDQDPRRKVGGGGRGEERNGRGSRSGKEDDGAHDRRAGGGDHLGDDETKGGRFSDRPAYALFCRDDPGKVACLTVRGTATIQDVVTDVRAVPVPFPQEEEEDEGGEDSRRGRGGRRRRSGSEAPDGSGIVEGGPDDGRDEGGVLRGGRGDEEGGWTAVSRPSGLALCGMAGAARNIFRETADTLLYLAKRGYRVRIVGHSLGGGVAALLALLVSRRFEERAARERRRRRRSRRRGRTAEGEEIKEVGGEEKDAGEEDAEADIDEEGFVKAYGYGTPSCVDARLADDPRTAGLVTSVVLHDDVVPRLTPTSVRGLLKHLLYIRETWVKTHLSDDLSAVTERAYHVWPTRLRGSFTLLKSKGAASARKIGKSCRKRIGGGGGGKEVSKAPRVPADDRNENDCIRSTRGAGSDDAACSTNQEESWDAKVSVSDEDDSYGDADEGVRVGGDLFFDPLDDPLNESDDEGDCVKGRNPRGASIDESKCDDDWVPFDEPPVEGCSSSPSGNRGDGSTLPSIDEGHEPPASDDASPQMLEEMPLPRMFIPGKIVHIYTHRGGYKAAFVPRQFRSLRRISMAGNMLSDHMSRSYYEGLLEVKAIRAAKQDLPPWVGFADDCTCACCASLFTWASTSDTEAQAARDKHNCRACGGLVCDPCSRKKVPIPAMGITVPVRVCDRCYNGWGTLFGDYDSDGESAGKDAVSQDHGTKVMISRRSAVVDELASRIPSII